MPWIILDGELLLCEDGQMCTAVQTPADDRPLSQPMSLLQLVCSKLEPRPSTCDNADHLVQQAQHKAGTGRFTVNNSKDCQNCEGVGSFQWNSVHRASQLDPVLPSILFVSLILGVAGGRVLHACRAQRW